MFQYDKPIYSLDEGLGYLAIGRAHAYKEMKAGRLEFVKNGKRTLLTARGIDNYIDLLEKESKARKAG